MTDTATDAAFRAEVRDWLEEQLCGQYADLRGQGGPGREDEAFDERLAWHRHLAKSGWACLGWPEQFADWIFVLARTEPGSQRHAGLSFLLVPIDQSGVEVRPIQQLTGDAEFNEVFFTGARTAADLVVGDVGDGWRVAMGLLGFERG